MWSAITHGQMSSSSPLSQTGKHRRGPRVLLPWSLKAGPLQAHQRPQCQNLRILSQGECDDELTQEGGLDTVPVK